MTPRRLLALLTALALLAGCAGVPRPRSDDTPGKVAVTRDQVESIYSRYREVRNTAVDLLDASPLSTVETGAVLAIDTGAFLVAKQLGEQQEEQTGPIDVTTVETPRLDRYPMWFFAIVRDDARDVQRVQVFERARATDPWLLVATPEALTSTTIPELRHGDGGHAEAVAADDGRGVAMSAEDAAAAYAELLADPESADADAVDPDDAFVQQIRAEAENNAALEGVEYQQTWRAEDVGHVLRTADGGALAFVTLLRTDTYTVDAGRKVTWPDGTPQKAFLTDGIEGGTGTLDHYHQVLVHLPAGTAKPRIIAQFGGVVRGQAD